jgi:hypothetical protein
MIDHSLSLLNVYEVDVDGATRHVVCFLDPVLAGAVGIDERSVVGEFTPGPDGRFDPATFRANPGFVEAFEQFMNDEASRAPEVVAQARAGAGSWLYLIDPRSRTGPEAEPPASDVVGGFAVDGEGRIVPGSFRYNAHHAWFDPDSGASGLLADRQFYDWLHPMGNR